MPLPRPSRLQFLIHAKPLTPIRRTSLPAAVPSSERQTNTTKTHAKYSAFVPAAVVSRYIIDLLHQSILPLLRPGADAHVPESPFHLWRISVCAFVHVAMERTRASLTFVA